MKTKTLVLMGVAITCGLGASYMTSQLLAERQAPNVEKIDVLVVKKSINQQELIKEPREWLELKSFTKGEEPANTFTEFDQLKGRVVKKHRRVGDVLTEEDLYRPGEHMGLQNELPEGHRAIGIRVNNEEIAGGWAALPGSRVDIISTVRRGSDATSYAMVLLENVLVVSADTEMNRKPEAGAMPAAVVSVAVTLEDAARLRLAGAMGSLSLVLRPHGDKSKTQGIMVTGANVKAGSQTTDTDTTTEKEPSQPPVPAVPTPAPRVEVAAVPKTPEGTQHVIVIRQGEHTHRSSYLLNTHREVVNPELTPPRPQPSLEPAPATPSTEDPQAPPT